MQSTGTLAITLMQGIDLESDLEFVRIGTCRPSLFMGFAVNLANYPNACAFDLSHLTKYLNSC